jgi:hypothetical protein
MLLDCTAEMLQAPPGSSSFAPLGSGVHSQRLSFIWSRHTALAADAAAAEVKKMDKDPCDSFMESESADAAAVAASASASFTAAAAAADPDDTEDSSVYEDKYARLIGLRATLDKCR